MSATARRPRPLPGSVDSASGGVPAAPGLAVVILAVGAPPELETALESLQRQSVPLEIVVVNSKGGDPRALVPADAVGAVTVISVPELLWPAAARNAGIRASRAPWIAFMACDHVARDDCAAARLELHRRAAAPW